MRSVKGDQRGSSEIVHPSSKGEFKPEIELFRVVSSFGIVWFHSGMEVGRGISYGGLIFFVIVSSYFCSVSKHPQTFFRRAERYLVPCVVWSVFYAVISFARNGSVFPESYGYFSMVLATPSIHLWFLPFNLLVLLVIDRLRSRMAKEWLSVFAGVTSILMISLSPTWRSFNYISPLGQYAHAIPATLIGVFLGTYKKDRFWLWLSILAGIVMSILFVIYKGSPSIGIAYAVGLAPCLFLFKKNILIKNGQFVSLVASSTFGVYLLHVFVLKLANYVGVTGRFLPVVAFFLSVISVLAIKRWLPNKIVKYVV